MSRLDADKNGNPLGPPARPAAAPPRSTPLAVWRGSAVASSAASSTDTMALLKALARRWPLALVLGLILAGAGAAAAWYLLAAPYAAFAQVRVASKEAIWVAPKTPEEGRSEFLTYLRTQARHLKSRFVLSEALKRDEVKNLPIVLRQPDPLVWLEDELQVESQEGSEFISVTLRGPEPSELTALVNAVVKAYEKEIVEAENAQRAARLAEVDKQYRQKDEALRRKKDSLKDMAAGLGTTDSQALSQMQQELLHRLSERERQYGEARTQRISAQLRLDAHKAQQPKQPEEPNLDSVVNELFDADVEAKDHKKALDKYKDAVAEFERRRPGVDDPYKKYAQREAEKLQKKIDEKRVKIRALVEERLRTQVKVNFEKAKVEHEALRPGLANQVEVWTEEEKRLQKDAEDLARQTAKFGQSSTSFEMLRSEVARDSEIVTDLGKNLDILRMEQGRPPRVTIFQEAALQKHDLKRQALSAVCAALAGLFFAGFSVSWLECRARRIHSADEVTSALGLRVVGAVPPTAPTLLHLAAAVADGKQQPDEHHFLESIDGIRTMLLRDARAGGLRLVMVTSAVSGEGKTTLASHLAGSLARAGRRTLLVDCDLRRPSAHQLFEVPSHPGLSEVLLGEVPAAEAVRGTAIPGLWMLPAGQWDRAVLRALAGEEVQKVFAALRQHYDFVIIDSHPVLQAADSLLVGLHADAVILALMRDLSRMPRVSAACQRLTDLGIPVLGAVVNGLPEDEAMNGSYAYSAAPARAPVANSR